MSSVVVSLVVTNERPYIRACLESVLRQTYQDAIVSVADNGSIDGSLDVLREYLQPASILELGYNAGYVGGHNAVASRTASDYILLLNPDVILEGDFVERCVEVADADQTVGGIAGRIFAIPKAAFTHDAAFGRDVIDTTGIFPKLLGMYSDRGQGRIPTGRPWETLTHEVFGISGCAAFYRRSALMDVSEGGLLFDPSLFLYFDDVDLAWRLQMRAWRLVYCPPAVAYHARTRPGTGKKDDLPSPVVQAYTTRNRWVVSLKTLPWPALVWKFPFMIARDVSLIPRWPTNEWSTPRGYLSAARAVPDTLRRRRCLIRSRRVSLLRLMRWFDPRAARGAKEHR